MAIKDVETKEAHFRQGHHSDAVTNQAIGWGWCGTISSRHRRRIVQFLLFGTTTSRSHFTEPTKTKPRPKQLTVCDGLSPVTRSVGTEKFCN